jgi:hypothetical protein
VNNSNPDPSERANQQEFAAAVAASQRLLRYAAQAGIELSDSAIAALVHAKNCLDAGQVPEEAAVAFYAALTTLAAKAAPVSADTLHISEEKTRRDLRRNGAISVALTLLVVFFSGVTFVTVSMSKDIETGIDRANELAVKLADQVGPPDPDNISDETSCAAPGSGPATLPKPPIQFSDKLLMLSELQEFAATIRTVLRTASKLDFFVWDWEISPLQASDPKSEWKTNAQAKLQLQPGLVNMRKETFCKIAAYQDVRQFGQNVRSDIFAIYNALSNYLLPVLYALLGALAFNLRDFSQRVARHTYHPSSYANTARTIAAITIGAIISLFNIFNRDTALQPLALAFLAGYGVEAFFAFLDTLLLTFGARSHSESAAARSTLPP